MATANTFATSQRHGEQNIIKNLHLLKT